MMRLVVLCWAAAPIREDVEEDEREGGVVVGATGTEVVVEAAPIRRRPVPDARESS